MKCYSLAVQCVVFAIALAGCSQESPDSGDSVESPASVDSVDPVNPVDPLVGQWRSIEPDITLEFHADNTYAIKTGSVQESGTWKRLNDGEIEIDGTNKGKRWTEVMNVTVDDGGIAITEKGRTERFTAVNEALTDRDTPAESVQTSTSRSEPERPEVQWVDSLITAMRGDDFESLFAHNYAAQKTVASLSKKYPNFAEPDVTAAEKIAEYKKLCRTQYESKRSQEYPIGATFFAPYNELAQFVGYEFDYDVSETRPKTPDGFYEVHLRLTFKDPNNSPLDTIGSRITFSPDFDYRYLKRVIVKLVFSIGGKFANSGYTYDTYEGKRLPEYDVHWEDTPHQILNIKYVSGSSPSIYVYVTHLNLIRSGTIHSADGKNFDLQTDAIRGYLSIPWRGKLEDLLRTRHSPITVSVEYASGQKDNVVIDQLHDHGAFLRPTLDYGNPWKRLHLEKVMSDIGAGEWRPVVGNFRIMTPASGRTPPPSAELPKPARRSTPWGLAEEDLAKWPTRSQALLTWRVCPDGVLSTFLHGLRCVGYYKDGKLVDIAIAGTPSEKAHDEIKHLVHAGIDIAAPVGSAVYSIADGKVRDTIRSASDPNFNSLGYMALIEHEQQYKGKPTYSIYLHLNEPPAVEVGTAVEAGQTQLGAVGSTGAAHGSHLHMEVRHFHDRFNPRWGNIYGIIAGGDDPAAREQLSKLAEAHAMLVPAEKKYREAEKKYGEAMEDDEKEKLIAAVGSYVRYREAYKQIAKIDEAHFAEQWSDPLTYILEIGGTVEVRGGAGGG